ncbi:MAG: hypothetical protein AB2387_13905 [Stutzerimonas stutzeri]|jgi:hypothetical protein
MNEIFSRLLFESESLDTAFYRPVNPHDTTLVQDLNTLATLEGTEFSIQINDAFDEKLSLPARLDPLNFNIEIVSFVKHKSPDTKYFFSTQGLLKNLGASGILEAKNIYIFGDFDEFETLTCKFKKWDPYKPTKTQEENNTFNLDARKIVSDFTGMQISPNHLFWVTNEIPSIPRGFVSDWLEFATGRASILLLSEISTSNGRITYTLKGNKNLEFHPNEKSFDLPHSSHIKIHSALYWIFETAREAETRHTLLCQRLANNDPRKSETWGEFIARTISPAVLAAKEDYKNHLLIKTGDLLKSITDIRKTVADETNKLIEKTNNLTSNLLRDASIAFVVAALRQTLIAKDLLNKESASFLLLATAAWLVISICLTGYQNKLFINSQIRFRRNWSKGLNSLIPDSELAKISKRPLKDAIKNYRKIKNIIDFIYALLVLVILSALVFT